MTHVSKTSVGVAPEVSNWLDRIAVRAKPRSEREPQQGDQSSREMDRDALKAKSPRPR